jgi:hypothetical protein
MAEGNQEKPVAKFVADQLILENRWWPKKAGWILGEYLSRNHKLCGLQVSDAYTRGAACSVRDHQERRCKP